jgi:hypothetical protein
MTDLETLLRAVDELQPSELDQLNDYIQQRRRLTWWVVPSENLKQIDEIMQPVQDDAATMTDEEINTTIGEVLDEVRRERDQGRY